MAKQFLFVLQGRGSRTEKKLYAGANEFKKYFQSVSEAFFVDITAEDSDLPTFENGFPEQAVSASQIKKIRDSLEKENAERVVVIGSGCATEIPVVSYLAGRNQDLQVFWFDAHGDLNSPESSISKNIHGMPLRFLTEKRTDPIGQECVTIPSDRVHLVGARALDPPEENYLKANAIGVIRIGRDYWVDMNRAVKNKAPAYIHIDLDVIDPSEYRNGKCAIKHGMKISELVESVKFIRNKMDVVGLSILDNTEKNKGRIGELRDLIQQAVDL